MGFEWHPSFHSLFEKLAGSVHDIFGKSHDGAELRHAQLWECYLSGQMTGADLEDEVSDDPHFASYVDEQQRQFSRH